MSASRCFLSIPAVVCLLVCSSSAASDPPPVWADVFPWTQPPPTSGTMLVGDYDNDGWSDYVGFRESQSQLLFIRGLGNGTFAMPWSLHLGEKPLSIGLADYDLDGWPDVAVVLKSKELVVLYGRPNGVFEPGTKYPIEHLNTQFVAGRMTSADFNNDGFPDIAMRQSYGGGVTLFLSSGDGAFAEGLSLDPDRSVQALAAADFNNDGRTDLAALYNWGRLGTWWEHPHALVVRLGGSDGELLSDPLVTPFRTWSYGLGVGDLDEDGTLDAAISQIEFDVTVLRGRGDGTLVDPVDLSTQGSTSDVHVVDLDDDGLQDLLVGHGGNVPRDVGATFFPGRGDLTFEPPVRLVHSAERMGGMVLADFDGDDILDLVSEYYNAVFPGLGHGKFSEPPVERIDVNLNTALVGDFDEDGIDELLTGNDGQLAFLKRTATGEFNVQSTSALMSIDPRSLLKADFTGDGHLDIIEYSEVGETAFFRVHAGDGAGGFTALDPIETQFTDARTLRVDDWDEDGNFDLVYVYYRAEPDSMQIRFGDGQGDFSDPMSISVPQGLRPIDGYDVGDVSGDGRIDIVLTFRNSGAVYIIENGGGRSHLEPRVIAEFDRRGGSLQVLDANRDGISDLLVSTFGGARLLMADGHGGVRYHETVRIRLNGAAKQIELADLNQDGCMDLIPMGYGPSMLGVGSVIYGTREYAFGPGRNYRFGTPYGRMLAGDFNGDGRPELISIGGRVNEGLAIWHTYSVLENVLVCDPVDTTPPSVQVAGWSNRLVLPGQQIEFSSLFSSDDEDGRAGGVLRERLFIDHCSLLDGASYGNGDGSLTDESISVDALADLLQTSGCYEPRIEPELQLTIEVIDCIGNVTRETLLIPHAVLAGALSRVTRVDPADEPVLRSRGRFARRVRGLTR